MASVSLAAQPQPRVLRPQAHVRTALACGVPATSSASQPLARRVRQGGQREACGPPSAQGNVVAGGKNRVLFLDTVRLLKWVCALDMARCPFCQRGALRIIAPITQGEVISTILRHRQRAADPRPSRLPALAKNS